MTQKKFVTSEIGQEEVQVEMTMPRATVHLEVRVITGANKETPDGRNCDAALPKPSVHHRGKPGKHFITV